MKPLLPGRFPLLCALVLLAIGCPNESGVTGPDEPEGPPRPTITIESPAEGTIGTASAVTVSGTFTGEVDEIRVNEVAATVSGQTFSAAVPIIAGAPYTPLWAEAPGPGGWARDRRTYLWGASEEAAAPVVQGMALRMTDRGIDGLQDYVATLLTPDAVEQLIVDMDPLYTGEIAGTTVIVHATAASIGAMYMDMDARDQGIVTNVTLTDLGMDLTLDADWAGTWYGRVDVAAAVLEATIRLDVVDGALQVEPRDVAVQIVDLQIDFEGLWSWIESGLEAYLESMMEDSVAQMVSGEIATMINDTIAGVQSSFEFGTATVGGTFNDVQHDEHGLNVLLDLELDASGSGPTHRVTVAGQLPDLAGDTTPQQQVAYGAQVVLDDDALNAIGVALVASGMMTQHVEGELPGDLGFELTAALFTSMFPSLSGVVAADEPIVLDTAPTVPLIGRAAEGPDDVMDLYLPGFVVDFSADLGTEDYGNEFLYRIVVDGVLRVSMDEGELDIYSDQMTTTLMDYSIPCEADEGEDLGDLLKLVITLGMDMMVTDLTTLLEGMTLVPLEGGSCGPNDDHAALYADLITGS